jgi:hypothetical protein
VSVPARRRQVAYGRERGLSVRRACTLFSVARSALGYQGHKAAKDATVMERMRELSAQYPRYGDRRAGHRHRVDRAGQALAEWRHGELQRQVPRRVPEPRMVSVTRRGEGDHRSMAAALQRSASAFEPRLPHAERVRGSTERRSVPSCNGPGRCGMWAFAPWPVAPTTPRGARAGSKGRRLKLAVVRRIGAGQSLVQKIKVGIIRRQLNSRLEVPSH